VNDALKNLAKPFSVKKRALLFFLKKNALFSYKMLIFVGNCKQYVKIIL